MVVTMLAGDSGHPRLEGAGRSQHHSLVGEADQFYQIKFNFCFFPEVFQRFFAHLWINLDFWTWTAWLRSWRGWWWRVGVLDSPYHIIQKHLILDDWVGMVGVMAGWVRPTDPHQLRLVSHLVLTNRVLGVVGDQEGEDIILQAYTEYLMGQDKLGHIPWYVARLPIKDQLPLFSAFLTGISDREDQRLCLYLGREAGLNMDKVVVALVTKARHGDKQQMVDSLAWLGHDTELARAGARMVPTGVVEKVGREWRGEDLPTMAVREHLALQTYLTAMETFNDWFDHFQGGRESSRVWWRGEGGARWSSPGRLRRRLGLCSHSQVGG